MSLLCQEHSLLIQAFLVLLSVLREEVDVRPFCWILSTLLSVGLSDTELTPSSLSFD